MWKQFNDVNSIIRNNCGNFKTAKKAVDFWNKCMLMPMSSNTSSIQDNVENERFLAIFPEIVSSAVERGTSYTNSSLIGPWIKEMLEYNSAGGYRTRGLMTVKAYQMLVNPDNITEESMKRARILGWCAEMTAMILLDDIIDNSSTRRGKVCWYRRPQVGLRTINDCSVFESLVAEILRINFGNSATYTEILRCFNEAKLTFALGQHLDFTTMKKYDLFTYDTYKMIASTKMSNYTFKLPSYFGLLLTNIPYENAFKYLDDIITDMGILIMMQNDFMDCFGDETLAGKVGTDIQEGKCTWLAVSALKRLNPTQRQEFVACYGSDDDDKVQRVKQLYNELRLLDLYCEKERKLNNDIVCRIKALPIDSVIPSPVMLKLLDMMCALRSQEQKKGLTFPCKRKT